MIRRLHNPDFGILLLRLALGVVFINAGWLKLGNIAFVISGFASLGLPAWVAYLVAYAELLGGALLIFGLLVRYAGLVLAIIMLVATLKVHWPNGFSLANGGYEYTFALLLTSLALVTLGAGDYSLARLWKKGE